MSTLDASLRGRNALMIVGLATLVVAPIPYFVAFLFAYAFSIEPITPGQQAFFLLEIAMIAVLVALVATPFVRASAAIRGTRAFWLSMWISLAINLTMVGIGSVISAKFADQNSVTAEYSWPIDVALAAGLFGSAAVAARLAVRYRPL